MKILAYLTLLCCFTAHSYSYGAVVVLNGLTHVHRVDGDKIVTGKIHIRNSSNKESRVIIYKQDLIANCDSAIAYKDINSHSNTLGDWLTTNIDEKLLAPDEEYEIQYSISIPQDKAKKGSYWSVLMVEGAEPIKEENSNGVQINSRVRYAVQIIADCGVYDSPKLNFENVTIKKNIDNHKVIEVMLQNVADYSAKVKIALEIYDEKGVKIKTFESVSKRIYPQYCNTYEIEIIELPKGKYEGILVADNGKDLFGSNISLEIE